jgi:hypothetical protein
MVPLKQSLKSKYNLHDLGLCKRIVGINVEWTDEGIYLHSESYIRKILEGFNMLDCKPGKVPMYAGVDLSPTDEAFLTEHSTILAKLPYKALIGSLLYAALTTRMDIAFAVSYLSRFSTCYSDQHWRCAKHVLRYLQGTRRKGLFYPFADPSSISPPTLTLYADADFAHCKQTRRSTGGGQIYINDCLVGYSSRRQKIVTRSTCEAEYVQLADSVSDSIWFSTLLGELGFPQSKVKVYEDNQSTIKMASSTHINDRSKHIDIRHHHIREKVQDDTIELLYCPTEAQRADCLTKPLPQTTLEPLLQLSGMRSCPVGKSKV